MKKGVFLIMLVLTAVLGITSISYAAELTWDTVPGHHNQSILLGPDEKFLKMSSGIHQGESSFQMVF